MTFAVYSDWGRIPPTLARQTDALLAQAFPEEERREPEELHALLNGSYLELLLLCREQRLLGMIMVWNLPGAVFLENFAVERESRGHGLGASMLSFVKEHWGKPVLLEVEPPEGELQRRRIGFYERNGFCLSDYPYLMPNLRGLDDPLPLLLMSCPGPMSHAQARAAAELLYTTAYRDKVRPALPEDGIEVKK